MLLPFFYAFKHFDNAMIKMLDNKNNRQAYGFHCMLQSEIESLCYILSKSERNIGLDKIHAVTEKAIKQLNND